MARPLASIVIAAATMLFAVSCGAADFIRVDRSLVRWPASAPGATVVVTYAKLRSAYTLSPRERTLSPDNCGTMGPFDDIVAASAGLAPATAERALTSAFAAWEAVADLKFVEIADTDTANIVVGGSASGAGRAFANLSFHTSAAPSVGKALDAPQAADSSANSAETSAEVTLDIARAYVCLSASALWKANLDGDPSVFDLRYTFMHEIGHAIGLDHPGRTGSLMAFRYDERLRELQPADIAAVRVLYGPKKIQ